MRPALTLADVTPALAALAGIFLPPRPQVAPLDHDDPETVEVAELPADRSDRV
jgi:hypothetical protein